MADVWEFQLSEGSEFQVSCCFKAAEFSGPDADLPNHSKPPTPSKLPQPRSEGFAQAHISTLGVRVQLAERRGGLGVRARGSLFDRHIAEFARFEDVAAFEALDEFRVLFAGYDPHTRMFTLLVHRDSLEGVVRGWKRLVVRAHGIRAAPAGHNLPEFRVL